MSWRLWGARWAIFLVTLPLSSVVWRFTVLGDLLSYSQKKTRCEGKAPSVGRGRRHFTVPQSGSCWIEPCNFRQFSLDRQRNRIVPDTSGWHSRLVTSGHAAWIPSRIRDHGGLSSLISPTRQSKSPDPTRLGLCILCAGQEAWQCPL